MAYIWPIALVIFANTIYHICTKSVPQSMDPFASLTVSYTIGALASAALYLAFHRGAGFWREIGKLNWSPVVLGLAVVCMEVGYIYAYRAGWQVSKASMVQSAILSVALLAVGALAFHEQITLKKIAGIAVCLAGLYILQ